MAIINSRLRKFGDVSARGHGGKNLFKVSFFVVSDSQEEIEYIYGVLQGAMEKAEKERRGDGTNNSTAVH